MHEARVMITGVTGFIGNYLARYLVQYYPTCKISGISRNKPHGQYDYDHHVVDLSNQDAVTKLINQIKPDYIFHLAGLVFSYDWNALYQGNVMSTLNLLEAVKKSGIISHVIIAGSSAEYGPIPSEDLPVTEHFQPNPHSPYGMTKLWQTLIARYDENENVRINTGRIFNVIGYGGAQQLSTGNIFSNIIGMLRKKQELRLFVGDLQIKRDFLDIQDVCTALIEIALRGQAGGIYNICSGYSLSFQHVLDLCIAETELNIEIIRDETKPQNNYVRDIYGCNNKIKTDTNWIPIVTLEESVIKALNIN